GKVDQKGFNSLDRDASRLCSDSVVFHEPIKNQGQDRNPTLNKSAVIPKRYNPQQSIDKSKSFLQKRPNTGVYPRTPSWTSGRYGISSQSRKRGALPALPNNYTLHSPP